MCSVVENNFEVRRCNSDVLPHTHKQQFFIGVGSSKNMTTEFPKDSGKKRTMRAPPKQWNFSTSSPFTMFTFSWVSSLLNYGNENTLKQEDLPDCQQRSNHRFCTANFQVLEKVVGEKGVERADHIGSIQYFLCGTPYFCLRRQYL